MHLETYRKNLLDAEGIIHLEQDLRRMSRQELAPYFAAKSSGRITLSRLIRNIIWQAYERIKAGTEPPIEGNLRSFWYLWVKPVMSHISDDDNVRTDPSKTMQVEFARMVLDLKLFRYADFDFVDENWENRRIGTTRPGVMVFSEKRGWIRFLRGMYEDFGVSVLALGGSPSALTSEYTATHLLKVLPEGKQVRLIGIVDYDPSGAIIAEAFQQQLAAVGLAETTLQLIIKPKHYSREQLEIFKFPLPKRQKTKTSKWLKRTGGIGGKAYGLESESMPREQVRKLVLDLILPQP